MYIRFSLLAFLLSLLYFPSFMLSMMNSRLIYPSEKLFLEWTEPPGQMRNEASIDSIYSFSFLESPKISQNITGTKAL